jgi:aminoglycoside/choline kinase family phosphotransferase
MTVERRAAARDFLRSAGWGEADVSPLGGDASTRRYARLTLNGRQAMLMDQPQNAEAPQCPPGASPDQRQALGYNAIARLAGGDCGRFIATADFLRSKGLSAPEVYAADVAQGFVLIEDLGDDLYATVLAENVDEHVLYAAAVDALAMLHRDAAPQTLPLAKPLYAYDETALLAETDLITDWFMPLALGRAISEDERAEHRELWRETLRPLMSSPAIFVHRDYHAQNLFWLSEREGVARVGMIDFQDAVAGTKSYDIVSLLEDARRDVAPELAEAMTARYLDQMYQAGARLDEEQHRAEAAIMAAQRNAKIVGIFARLYKRDGKPRYLSFLPRVWRYLNRDLEHPALLPLKRWYDRRIPAAARSELRVEEVV